MKKIVLNIAAVIFCAALSAQGRGPTLGVNMQLTVPTETFSENYAGVPLGYGIQFAIPSGPGSMMEWGIDYSKNTLGSDNEQVTFQDGLNNLLAGDLSLKSIVNSYHAMGRFSPLNGSFRVYIDGYAGFRNFTTKSVLEYQNLEGLDVQTIYVANKDLSFSYGWGAGAILSLKKNLMFDVGFQKLKGGNVTMIDQNSIQIGQDGSTEFDFFQSTTDVMVPRVGLTLAF